MNMPFYGEKLTVKNIFEEETELATCASRTISIVPRGGKSGKHSYFRPLVGFHGIDDAISICEKMKMVNFILANPPA